ncbi:MAG: deoxyguanosinetriphosphate triphosphohydrolase [Alphaproteobacteria bacterium]|nr:MAG: deoxyguanosinetriphosphate triphosphohydrolase [Alphaproteobacteria bacterium]
MGSRADLDRSYLDRALCLQACRANQSRGRLKDEPESGTRTAFQRDRDRIIHSSAFRRLKHKTQVFVHDEGDYYRTRLTHSLEVAQIARSMCRYLGFDEDLSEAIALAHDLGHTPFGHAGEHILMTCMRPYEGFDHNAHSLRLVTEIERHYAGFNGLNLTWETLEGLVKHNGPLTGPKADGQADVPYAIRTYCQSHDLEIESFASVEAQLAALSDDIAYNNHDIDDGLRAGLFDEGELRQIDFVNDVYEGVEALHPGIEGSRRKHEVIRRLIAMMVEDAIETTVQSIDESGATCVDDIRALDHSVAGFSPQMKEKDRLLKEFLWTHMYRHKEVVRTTDHAKGVVKDLFEHLMECPHELPAEWRDYGDMGNEAARARVISDYIAGMTDRFALNLHAELFT